jgi:hypothetical protein
VLAFLRTMGHSTERLAYSNSVSRQGLVVQIRPRSRMCQQIVAARDAASARFFVAPLWRKGPELSMRLDKGGRTLATSHINGGWTGGTVNFPFRQLSATYLDARICVKDVRGSPLRFEGLATGVPTSTLVDGKPELATISIEFFRPGASDAWGLLPTVAHREGVLKGALAGGWSFWLAAGLVLLAGGAAIAVSLQGIRR